MHFIILFKSRRSDEYKLVLTLCVQNIAHIIEALHGYVLPRVGPRELYRLETALKIIITVPTFIYYIFVVYSFLMIIYYLYFTIQLILLSSMDHISITSTLIDVLFPHIIHCISVD